MASDSKITRFLWDGTVYAFQDERVDGLAKVATSGSYADLAGKPAVDAALSGTSSNAVQSKAVKAALDAKQDKLALDSTITEGSSGVPTSAAVRKYLSSQLEAIENGSY